MSPARSEAATAWWAGVPPVEVTIDCGGRAHRLRWEDGELTTPDHRGAGRRPPIKKGDPPRSAAYRSPEEVAGEGCVIVARGWRAFHRDSRCLVLGRRHPGESFDRQAAEEAEDPLARLLVLLDPALERRLQLEVAAGVADGGDASEAAVLEAATVGRLGRILDRWLGPDSGLQGRPGPGHGATVRIGDRSGVEEVDGQVIVTLAPTWLGQIWGRYLSLVDGFLVLEVNRIVPGRAEVIGVGRPGGDPAVLTLVGPGPWRAVTRSDQS